MPRIPIFVLGVFVGSAAIQFATGNNKTAIVCLILFLVGVLINQKPSAPKAAYGLKQHAPQRAHSPSFPLLKILAICTAGSCSLAIAASNHLSLDTLTTLLIALMLIVTTTFISMFLYTLTRN